MAAPPPPRPQPDPNEEMDSMTALASLLFDHIEGQIQFADTKAQLTLAANALLAASLTFFSSEEAVALFNNGLTGGEIVLVALNGLTLLALLLSVYFSLAVARPNLIYTGMRSSMMFFGHITEMSQDAYVQAFNEQTILEARSAILRQVHAKSRIVIGKFRGMRRSLDFLIVTLVLWALTQLASSLIG